MILTAVRKAQRIETSGAYLRCQRSKSVSFRFSVSSRVRLPFRAKWPNLEQQLVIYFLSKRLSGARREQNVKAQDNGIPVAAVGWWAAVAFCAARSQIHFMHTHRRHSPNRIIFTCVWPSAPDGPIQISKAVSRFTTSLKKNPLKRFSLFFLVMQRALWVGLQYLFKCQSLTRASSCCEEATGQLHYCQPVILALKTGVRQKRQLNYAQHGVIAFYSVRMRSAFCALP